MMNSYNIYHQFNYHSQEYYSLSYYHIFKSGFVWSETSEGSKRTNVVVCDWGWGYSRFKDVVVFIYPNRIQNLVRKIIFI